MYLFAITMKILTIAKEILFYFTLGVWNSFLSNQQLFLHQEVHQGRWRIIP